jgi:hypothetical protein
MSLIVRECVIILPEDNLEAAERVKVVKILSEMPAKVRRKQGSVRIFNDDKLLKTRYRKIDLFSDRNKLDVVLGIVPKCRSDLAVAPPGTLM